MDKYDEYDAVNECRRLRRGNKSGFVNTHLDRQHTSNCCHCCRMQSTSGHEIRLSVSSHPTQPLALSVYVVQCTAVQNIRENDPVHCVATRQLPGHVRMMCPPRAKPGGMAMH